jgi:hypothetical protein
MVMSPGSKPSKQQTLDGFLKAKPAAAEADGGAAAGAGGEAPVKVTTGLGAGKHDKEGRLITLEYASFFLVFAYVPNSGEGLKRIEYRLEEWDKDLRAYLKSLEASKPVVSSSLVPWFTKADPSQSPTDTHVAGMGLTASSSHTRAVERPLSRPHPLQDVYSSAPRLQQNALPQLQ